MKKSIIIFFYVLFFSVFISCTFEDDPLINDYTVVGFPNQTYVRNLVVGEGLQMKVGVVFSGVLQNNLQREVKFIVDPSLIPNDKEELPSDYYTLGHANTIIIPKGSLDGYLDVKLDSAKFVNDPKSLTGQYVLPLKIVSSSQIDSINAEKSTIIVSVSYFAKQQANYTYNGKMVKTKNSITETIYYKNNPLQNTSFRLLETVGPTRMKLVPDPNGSNDPANDAYSFELEVPIVGGTVNLLPAEASPINVIPVGESNYDAKNRTFILNYSYTLNDGTVCNATDTMVYRNRIRDVQGNGIYINEWW